MNETRRLLVVESSVHCLMLFLFFKFLQHKQIAKAILRVVIKSRKIQSDVGFLVIIRQRNLQPCQNALHTVTSIVSLNFPTHKPHCQTTSFRLPITNTGVEVTLQSSHANNQEEKYL